MISAAISVESTSGCSTIASTLSLPHHLDLDKLTFSTKHAPDHTSFWQQTKARTRLWMMCSKTIPSPSIQPSPDASSISSRTTSCYTNATTTRHSQVVSSMALFPILLYTDSALAHMEEPTNPSRVIQLSFSENVLEPKSSNDAANARRPSSLYRVRRLKLCRLLVLMLARQADN